MLTFGFSVLKFIAKNQSIEEFVLYNWDKRDSVLHDMLGELTPYQRTRYTTGEYAVKYGYTFPCIHLSASGVCVCVWCVCVCACV